MKSRTDIYNYDRQLVRYGENLNNTIKNKRNKELIWKFRDYCLMQGFSKARILRYYKAFKDIDQYMGKDFDKATKEDIERVVGKINAHKSWAVTTKHDTKVIVKRFYKWLYGKDEDYPDEVRWIKTKIKRCDKKLPSDGELLTEDDIIKAIRKCKHVRDKALIYALYESGCRIGELCSLRLKDVKIDKMGTVLSVTGKTGPRKVRVVACTQYITNWMHYHPKNDNRDAPLWVSIGNVNFGSKLPYARIRLLIKSVFQDAGIKKAHNPHLFRHSRATFLANHLTEFQMNHYFGWVQGSNMPSTYVHMSGKQIDDAIMKMNGFMDKVEEKPVHKAIMCKRCDTINTSDSTYCTKCGCVVSQTEALKLDAKEREQAYYNHINSNLANELKKENPELFRTIVQRIGK